MKNIKEVIRDRILIDMVGSVKTKSGWKALILDEESMRIISAACRMYDIMEEGVAIVEKVNIARQPLPTMEAIYFLTPQDESLELLVKDFEKKDKPQYAAVHLFLTSRLDDDDLEMISKSNVGPRLKTLKEINVDFLAIETQAFHFDSPSSFKNLFSPETKSLLLEQNKIANKIVSVCATLGENPIIRYAKEDTKKEISIATSLASVVQTKINDLVRSKALKSESEDTATLLILDRSIDPVGPLLHEFSYQAMVYDLLNVKNDIIKYDYKENSGKTAAKEVILSEKDALWPDLRHTFIAEAIDWLVQNFKEFTANNKATALLKEGGASNMKNLKEMGEALRSMPDFQEMYAKYSLHIHLTNLCMETFHKNQLERVAEIEQNMATGENISASKLPEILSDEKISIMDKVRVLMIYIISQEGIQEQNRKRLMSYLGDLEPSLRAAIPNLYYIGVSLQHGSKKKKKKKEKVKKSKFDDALPYELARYVTEVKDILHDLVEGKLDSEKFPYVQGAPAQEVKKSVKSRFAGKSVQPKWSQADKKNPAKKLVGGRIIVYMAGGMSYAEMRAAYEITEKYDRQIFIGSDCVLTPETFLARLGELKKVETLDSI